MLTNKEAQQLLRLEKVLADPVSLIDLRNKKNRLELISNENTARKFLLEVTSNTKIILKTSIHHLETDTYVGLLRIDFRGRHKNPEEILTTLPPHLRSYAGKWFGLNEPHMHVFVEGYPPLCWAVPLKDTEFEVKEISVLADLTDLILNFAKEINLVSKLHIQQAIL